jgi:hypothetical protein
VCPDDPALYGLVDIFRQNLEDGQVLTLEMKTLFNMVPRTATPRPRQALLCVVHGRPYARLGDWNCAHYRVGAGPVRVPVPSL